jgi:hypothetical protein
LSQEVDQYGLHKKQPYHQNDRAGDAVRRYLALQNNGKIFKYEII